MSTSPPSPKRATESDVDAVIEKIDAALPMVYQRAEESKRAGRPSSDSFSRAEIQKTRDAFVQMGEDSLLTGSGQDIQMHKADMTTPPQGSQKPKPRPRLFYRHGA